MTFPPPILREGDNCRGLGEGLATVVYVDGCDYYQALAEALPQAQHHIYIAGWAIDGQVWLTPTEKNKRPLLPLLSELVQHKPDLRVSILIWDLAAANAWSQRAFPLLQHDWRGPRRIQFRYDDQYPLGACHHQKFVVIDDQLGFCGGIDLTVGRWDTPEHLPDDPRRGDAYDEPHGPFHDAQAAVTGRSAQVLGELFRTRWKRATKQDLPLAPSPPLVPAPEWGYHFHAERTAISITDPMASPKVREIEQLFFDSIKAARSRIYIENQYLTSRTIGDALAERLQEADGPEVVVIGPRQPAGWLEEVTVGLLRWRVVARLRKADVHKRLRIFYAMSSVEQDIPTYVHIKLAIIDDWFVRVGSANISARSLGIDSECDMAFEVLRTPEAQAQVRHLRHCLMAEHVGVSGEDMAAAEELCGSAGGALEALCGADKTLLPLGGAPLAADLQLAEDGDVFFDPTEPLELASFAEAVIGRRAKRRLLERLPRGLFSVLALMSLWVLWHLGVFDAPDTRVHLIQWTQGLHHTTGGDTFLVVVGGIALSLGLPLVVLVFLSVGTLGPGTGFLMAMLSGLLGTTLNYGYGRLLGRHLVRLLLGVRVNEISRQVVRRGVLSFGLLRALPVTAFAYVGIVAGAACEPYRNYTAGSALGMMLYVGFFTVVVALVGEVRWQADFVSLALVMGGFLLTWGVATLVRVSLGRRAERLQTEAMLERDEAEAARVGVSWDPDVLRTSQERSRAAVLAAISERRPKVGPGVPQFAGPASLRSPGPQSRRGATVKKPVEPGGD